MEPWEQAAQAAQAPVQPSLEPWEAAAAAQPKPSMLDRIGQDYANRAQDVQSFSQPQSNGAQGQLSQLNALGNSAGFLFKDIPAEAVKSLTPEVRAPQWVQATGSAIGDAASHLVPEVHTPQWAQGIASSRPAHALATGANLVAIPAAVNAADSLYNVGQKAFNDARAAKSADFLQNVVTPHMTAADKVVAAKNSVESGFNKTATVIPNPEQLDMMHAADSAGVQSGNSHLANLNIVQNANNAEAENLKGILQAHDVPVSQEIVNNGLQGVRDKLNAMSFDTGNPSAAADKMINIANDAIANNPRTASGLLQARKDFDARITELHGPNAFSATRDSPSYAARMETRKAMNDMIVNTVTPTSEEALASMKSDLGQKIDEYGKLRQLQTHLENTVNGTAQFAGKQGGFWRQRTITQAADDAKNLFNVKQQVATQAEAIKAAESKINNIAQVPIDVKASLARQHNLFKVEDALASKVPHQANSASGRFGEKLRAALPNKKYVYQAAAATGAYGANKGVQNYLDSGSNN